MWSLYRKYRKSMRYAGLWYFFFCGIASLGLFFFFMQRHGGRSTFNGHTAVGYTGGQKHNGVQKDLFIKQGNKVVEKYVLNNGLTVLVRKVTTTPKLSVQMFYHVGSKDELSGERGIAHLIEHMVFKGTERLLSESDINTVVHKLSGSCNAFTTYDFTSYLFNIPNNCLEDIFPIIVDCMHNVAFKEEHLSSEMKAVIQEFKMYRDNYERTLAQDMLSALFVDHPYHYPIIGFKQDLWSVTGDHLKAFYKKHYHVNNAVLVVVGDIEPESVFRLSENYFGHLQSDKTYKKEQFYFNKDIVQKSVTLHRDVKQPKGAVAFVVPGVHSGKEPILNVLLHVLGKTTGSRLYQKIVREKALATSLHAFYYDLFDHAVFFIFFDPKDEQTIDAIVDEINRVLDDIVVHGVNDREIDAALNMVRMEHYQHLEDIEHQASAIGEYYLATGDHNYIFNYLKQPKEVIAQQVRALVVDYFSPLLLHKGVILPLSEKDKVLWKTLQQASDQEDKAILSQRVRTTPIEPPSYALTLDRRAIPEFNFPQPEQEKKLSNGAQLLVYTNKTTPTITVTLMLKANPFYDSLEKPGLYKFVSVLLKEGTEAFDAKAFAQELNAYGMTLTVSPGMLGLSLIKDDLPHGLFLLNQVLAHATFDEKNIEKIRLQRISAVKSCWDSPGFIMDVLIKEHLYKDHPYSKNIIGTEASIASITQDDLRSFYKQYISPDGAIIAVVGDIDQYDVIAEVEKGLSGWNTVPVADINLLEVASVEKKEKKYQINRDQVIFALAGLSVDIKSEHYYKLMLFDQIFGGGMLGSMHSRLFRLREETGLFYTIHGTTTSGAGWAPGAIMVKTIVSLDHLAQAEQAILQVIDTVVESITEKELAEAKRAVTSSLSNRFRSNRDIAGAFLMTAYYNFPFDYYQTVIKKIEHITLEEVKASVQSVLSIDKLSTFYVGRVDDISKDDNKDGA